MPFIIKALVFCIAIQYLILIIITMVREYDMSSMSYDQLTRRQLLLNLIPFFWIFWIVLPIVRAFQNEVD